MTASAIDLSFEFFPPRNEGGEAGLERTVNSLRELRPDYCSVTYGAGGSTRDGTMKTAVSYTHLTLPTTPYV